jgi:DNA-binding NarL/FixJ family response regulator
MEQDVRVVMVDVRQGFLDAVALVLAEHRTLRLVGSARTIPEALAHDLAARCDVVAVAIDDLADVCNLQRLCIECPSLGVVVLSPAGGEVHLPDALAWGVRGWVSRQDGVNELLDALIDVAAGEAHLPAEPLHAMFAAALRERPDAVLPDSRPLTERESAVLDCLAAGMTRHDIGIALDLSDNTVRTYVRRILRKLHVHSASAAVALTRSEVQVHG